MNENHFNTAKGRDFQHLVCRIIEGYFHTQFDLEVPFYIGAPPKPHCFDCASQDRNIVIECKCYSWTAGGNVPSAKMTTINEAAFYMSFLPQDIRRIIVIKKSTMPNRSETLAQYYYRINGHLLGQTEVFEVDDEGSIRIIKGKTDNPFHEERNQPAMRRLLDISTLWNHGSEEDWEAALDHYWKILKPANLQLEREFDNLEVNVLKQMSVIEFYHFLYNGYFVWKYTAANRLATTRKNLSRHQSEGRMDELEWIQKTLFSFDHRDIQKGLEIARRINGLGTAGASGLLSILFPQDFGTVDQFVVKSLLSIEGIPEHSILEKMRADSLKLQDGVALIKIMRNKAKALNERFETDRWTPRLIDKVLWCVGR